MSKYIPAVNDYVLWDKGKFSVEGWVYFIDSAYITIEIGVKCKDEDEDRKSTRLNSSHSQQSRMPSSA